MPKNDVTESLAKELLELQRTLGWMDLVIGSITDAVYVTDAQARIVFANQFFSDLLGTPRVFLLGKHLQEVFPTQIDQESSDEIDHDSVDDARLNDETKGVYAWNNNGKNYIFKISSRRLMTTNQTVYLAQDITREHELSRMKSSFIDLASHQLRTPMTAIMTYSHMLNDGYGGEIDPLQKEMTKNVMQASERMIRLINDILNITRIQNEGIDLRKQKMTLEEVFNRIDLEIKSRIEQKEIAYTKTIPKGTPEIISSASMLHEILSNLIVNAIQYTPVGGRISAIVSHDAKIITIKIKDNGIGIPKDDLPRIFDQFSRADNAFAAFNEGTGLGLYLVKILLARIGGTIDCKSIINKGTTFTVKIPVAR